VEIALRQLHIGVAEDESWIYDGGICGEGEHDRLARTRKLHRKHRPRVLNVRHPVVHLKQSRGLSCFRVLSTYILLFTREANGMLQI